VDLQADAAGNLKVNLVAPAAIDLSDRPARQLGVVYGSQGQQLLQRTATFDLEVQLRSAGAEIDPRVQGTPGALANAWPVKITDGTLLQALTNIGSVQGVGLAGIVVYQGDIQWTVIPAVGSDIGVDVNDNTANARWLGTPENTSPAAGGAEPGVVLAARSNAAAPVKGEGKYVSLSTDLSGGLRAQAPTVLKTVDAAALGNTAVWTPAAGKKFRLMGGLMTIDGSCTLAAAGSLLVTLQDAVAALGWGIRVALPAAAVTQDTDVVIPIGPFGQGVLSAAANNPLNVNLGTALAAGNVRTSVWGTEE